MAFYISLPKRQAPRSNGAQSVLLYILLLCRELSLRLRRTDGYAARRGQSNTVEIGNGIGNELDGDRGLARFEIEHTEFDLRVVEARAERAAPPDHACGYFKRSNLAVVRNGYLIQLIRVDPRIIDS